MNKHETQKKIKNNCTVKICKGPSCSCFNPDNSKKSFEKHIKRNNLKNVNIDFSLCMGRCKSAPNFRVIETQTTTPHT